MGWPPSYHLKCPVLSSAVSDPLSRIILAPSTLKDTGREAMKMTGVGVSTVLVFDKSTEQEAGPCYNIDRILQSMALEQLSGDPLHLKILKNAYFQAPCQTFRIRISGSGPGNTHFNRIPEGQWYTPNF